MDNLINVFMNFKINHLIKCGLLFYRKDSKFIRKVFTGYYKTYIDNYYYNIFNTIDDTVYSEDNLKLEFDGIQCEMLEDYKAFELQVSNEEYSRNVKVIKELRDIAFEAVKVDSIKFNNNNEINEVVTKFVNSNEKIKNMVEDNIVTLINYCKDYYHKTNKLLNYQDSYFKMGTRYFVRHKDYNYMILNQNIKSLDNYRSALIKRVYKDDNLNVKKFTCLIQKISLEIIKCIIKGKDYKNVIVDFYDEFIYRGKITNKIYSLIDNPLIRKYVVFAINYNVYTDNKKLFEEEDFKLACMQDFTYINDIYQKTENICAEGVFNYLIVKGCKFKDTDYFLEFQRDGIEVLIIEEE